GRNLFFGMLRDLAFNFFIGAVRESKYSGLKLFVNERGSRELVDLLLFDRVGRNDNDLAGSDKHSAGDFSHYGIKERDNTAIERDGNGVTADRHITDVEDLLFIDVNL